MQVSLHDRIILVTGSAQGIGRSCARLAARSGAAGILLTDRNEAAETGRLVREDGRAHGTEVGFVAADLLDRDAPLHIAQACLSRFGRIDGLINAAGLTDRGSLAEATPALWDLLFTVNARAPGFLMQHCIADMTGRAAPGAIVNILSMQIHCGAAELAIYAASKAALAALTRNAAQAHRFDRIRVNGINVGWTDTAGERVLHDTVLGKPEGWLDEQGAAQPLGRLMVPEDVARLAIFLLSDASLPMTGGLLDHEQWVTGGDR